MYIRGAVIKNPVSFSLGFLRQFNLSGIEDLNYSEKYYYWKARHNNVSVTLPTRTSHIKYYLSNNGVRASQTDNNVRVKSKPLTLINTFDKPEDISHIVNKLCEWLLPVQDEISQDLKNDFINIVVGNNPNIWEDEYNDYLNEPSEEKEESLNKKLRSLLKEICLMPEYYLS